MRLFLSSYRAGDHANRLLELVPKGSKIVVVTNAGDYKDPTEKEIKVLENLDFFKALGYKVTELDLRNFFENQKGLEEIINDADMVWLAGGNTFILRQALEKSGLDNLLVKKVRDDKLIYGGESAGAVMATPTFEGIELVDDPEIFPDGYEQKVLTKGLGFVDFAIVPHYQSPEFGDEINAAARILDKKQIKYLALRDDQVIILDNEKTEVLG